ncbi:alpha-methylacyl-CoA racemase isoform X2 [Palaemon carinicauda]|uniref:alpha-methylacyl-CoA racemase isoform X2 n=1 Tax=Palaemon carinicauda TaxID=392227 RepID=UPI0035B5D69A
MFSRMALRGIKVVELAGLAPAPFCGMILSDFGANVIRVDKPTGPHIDRSGRGKRSVVIDLKKPDGINVVKRMCSKADILIEPYRPGVMEKIGLGPADLMKENPKLIYARLTGFGQTGPYAEMAGHDINYVAISGLLSMLGRKEGKPTPPINLLADFAGGGLMCAFGISLALLERSKSGLGQVIDASMVEGAAYTGSWLYSSRDLYIWKGSRGSNWLDSGVHFYDTYETKDGKYMAVGAIEPQFYQQFITLLGLTTEEVGQLDDPDEMKKIIGKSFSAKTREEWTKVFEGKDACVTPVLSMDEAPLHPHNVARGSFIKASDGHFEPKPAPLLSRTPGTVIEGAIAPKVGQHTCEVLNELGYTKQEIDALLCNNVAEQLKEKANL